MKTEAEIQKAHDILASIILGNVKGLTLPSASKAAVHCAADVLCWVLGHDHNKTFGKNLEALELAISKLGYELTGPVEPPVLDADPHIKVIEVKKIDMVKLAEALFLGSRRQ